MSANLSKPLVVTQDQITVAQAIWESLEGWKSADQALALAREAFPDNTDLRAVLLKAALLDRLYSTNVKHLPAAARRIVRVLGNASGRSGRDIVPELARVSIGDDETLKLTSFASKYVHFFHDDSVAIVDSYAALALTVHFGQPKVRAGQWTGDYPEYCAKIDNLVSVSAVSATAREIDHYLWLAGNWITSYEKGAGAKINRELLSYFRGRATAQIAEMAFRSLVR